MIILKFKNRLKKILVGACTVAVILLSSVVGVLADETAVLDDVVDENIGSTFDGKQIPYLPVEVYGKDFVLFYQGYSELRLFIFDKGSYMTIGGTLGSSTAKYITVVGNAQFCSYTYKESTGWSEPEYIDSKEFTYTPPALYIIRTTFDIYNTDDGSLMYPKSANIIDKPMSMEVMRSFGSMMNGFFSGTEKNPVALFCFACVVGVGLIGILRQFISVRF